MRKRKTERNEAERRWRGNAYYQDGAYRKKPRPPPSIWNLKSSIGLLIAVVVATVLVVVGFIYYSPFTPNKAKSIVNNRAEPLPCIINETVGYQYIAEDSEISKDYKYYFYAGRLTFAKAQEVCNGLPGGGTHVTFESPEQEALIDKKIQLLSDRRRIESGSYIWNDDDKIETAPRQMWTGGYFNLDADDPTIIQWKDAAGLSVSYSNFCSPKKAKAVLDVLVSTWTRNTGRNPIIHLVKDYRPVHTRTKTDRGLGCWRLYDPATYSTENIEMYFVCQTHKDNEPFKFVRKFNGKFRYNKTTSGNVPTGPSYAMRYVLFSGSGSYQLAIDTCRKYGDGVTMLSPRTLNRDEDINRQVSLNRKDIFGEDSGDPNRRTLVWTGGYFNLSSKFPTKIRWTSDPTAPYDLPKKPKIQYWGASKDKAFSYENFCAPFSHYEQIIVNALQAERDAANTTGCIKGRLFVIVKDFRDGQASQGCWHVYDHDYLSRYSYKLHLVCTLPDVVYNGTLTTNYAYEESKEVFRYNSKFPDVDWRPDDVAFEPETE